MRYGLTFILALLLANVAVASEYAKKEFGYGFPLETDGQGAIYSITLPHDVYAKAVRVDLRDLKVFNAQGQTVPHELRYADAENDAVPSRVSLPFFPLYNENGKKSTAERRTTVSMHVETGDNGEIIRIRRTGERSTKNPASYLFDLEEVKEYPVTLHFQWKSEGPNALLPVVLESSKDLIHWSRAGRATLADLVFLGSHLQNDEVELERHSGRYLRLRAERGEGLPAISSVTAVSNSVSDRRKRRWIVRSGSVEKENEKVSLRVDLAGMLPLEALDLAFQQPNSLLKLRVRGLDHQDIWHDLGDKVFYRLAGGGNELTNTPMRFKPVGGKRRILTELKLEVLENGVGDGLESVKVRMSYLPRELLFIARGEGPFLLAYGNAKMANEKAGGAGLGLGEIGGGDRQDLVEAAQVGEKIVLAGNEALVLPGPNPWNERLLWLALFTGVAVLAVMAWSLARQIKR